MPEGMGSGNRGQVVEVGAAAWAGGQVGGAWAVLPVSRWCISLHTKKLRRVEGMGASARVGGRVLPVRVKVVAARVAG